MLENLDVLCNALTIGSISTNLNRTLVNRRWSRAAGGDKGSAHIELVPGFA
jgi:hypothetical protein